MEKSTPPNPASASCSPQRFPVETVVAGETGTMKRTVFPVQIGDAQPAARSQQVMKGPQQSVDIGDVVQSHQGIDQIIALDGQWIR